jgi:hypothetical protein
MGQVIGQSDRLAARPPTERYTPAHLLATVLHTLLDLGQVRVQSNLGRLGTILTDGSPIPEFFWALHCTALRHTHNLPQVSPRQPDF